MKVYIYDEFLERTDKLCEASKGNAHLIRNLWIEHYNSVVRANGIYASYAVPGGEEDGKLMIKIKDLYPKPTGY